MYDTYLRSSAIAEFDTVIAESVSLKAHKRELFFMFLVSVFEPSCLDFKGLTALTEKWVYIWGDANSPSLLNDE